MKKLLLTLTCLLTLFTAMAGTVTFDFKTNDYGLTRQSENSGAYIDKGTTVTNDGVTITLNKTEGKNGWRLWTDGLRAYKNSDVSMLFNAGESKISKIEFTQKSGVVAKYTAGDGAETEVSGSSFSIACDASEINVALNVASNGAIYTVTVTTDGGSGEPDVPVENVKVDNIQALITANADLKDGDSTETFEFTNPVTAIYQNGMNLYVKDDTGYMMFYGATTQKYNNGDLIPAGITGKFCVYKGLPEFKFDKESMKDATAGEAVEPITTTVDDAAGEGLNAFIKLSNVSIPVVNGRNFTIADGDVTIPGYNTFVVNLSEGENLNIVGFVSYYYDTYQILPLEILNASGQELVSKPVFSPSASNQIEAGTLVTIYTATDGASIYYTVNGDEPTTSSTLYSAPFAINEDATVKAIAVKEGMANSSVATIKYSVKTEEVSAAMFDFAKPETLTPAYPADINGEGLVAENANKSASINNKHFNVGNVAVSNTKGSTDAKIYYQSNGKIQLRVYNGGSTVIESTDPNNNITEVVFKFNNGKTNYSVVKAPEVGTWVAESCTWTGNASNLIFNYTGNVQINSIEVTCEKGITEGNPIIDKEPQLVEVASIKEWLDANVDVAVGKDSFDSYKFTCPLSVARKIGNNLYVTDGKDWMLVFSREQMPAYNNGDIIPAGVEGVYSNYNGLPQMKPVIATLGEATAGEAIEPIVTTLDKYTELGASAYVKFVDVNLTDLNGRDFNVTDGTTVAAGYNIYNLEGLENADHVDIVAFVGLRFENYQINIADLPTPNVSAGIDEVTTDSNAPVEYFNLQGMRVENPRHGGLYIKRQGNTVSKVLVR